MSVIELKDITMSYGPNRILEHFNLSVEQGTFLTMIGSSGCGKTTALKLMTARTFPIQISMSCVGESAMSFRRSASSRI